jgi:hypothetical protein
MTNEHLKLSYQRWNAEFFSGVLPEMPVVFRAAGEFYGLGAFECLLRETKMPFSISMIPGTGSIEISDSCREGDWEGVLMHEMVHAYFASVGLGRESHGTRFQAKCEKIEKQWGRTIPRTLRVLRKA